MREKTERVKKVSLFLIGLLIALIVAANAKAVSNSNPDLANYPLFFIEQGRLDLIIVVGDNAASSDAVAALDINTSLQYASRTWSSPATINIQIKKSSEIGDPSAQNLVVIGNPCVNSLSAKILGSPSNCAEGFEAGTAMIKLFTQSTGKVALLVAGESAMDTRKASRVLADYAKWQEKGVLKGTEIEVTGTFQDINVIAPTPAPTSPQTVIPSEQTNCDVIFDQICYDSDSTGQGYIFTRLGNFETSLIYTGVMIHYIAGAENLKELSGLSIQGGMEFKINTSIENIESLADAAGNVQKLEFTPLISVSGKETPCSNKFVVKNIKTCSNKLENSIKSEEKAPANKNAFEQQSSQLLNQGSDIKEETTRISQVQFARRFFKASMIPYALLGAIVIGGLIFTSRKFVLKDHSRACPKCGSQLKKGDSYCQECGEKVT